MKGHMIITDDPDSKAILSSMNEYKYPEFDVTQSLFVYRTRKDFENIEYSDYLMQKAKEIIRDHKKEYSDWSKMKISPTLSFIDDSEDQKIYSRINNQPKVSELIRYFDEELESIVNPQSKKLASRTFENIVDLLAEQDYSAIAFEIINNDESILTEMLFENNNKLYLKIKYNPKDLDTQAFYTIYQDGVPYSNGIGPTQEILKLAIKSVNELSQGVTAGE